MHKAALYGRFSTDRQDKTSTADQLRVCGDYADQEGWTVTARFTDEELSGEALGNRPGVQSLINGALSARYSVIIVNDLTRLARGEDLPKLIQRLKFHGCRVIGVQDGFDSDARWARMQAGMAGIVGGEFIDMIRHRVRSALEMRAKAKQPTGGRAYGYDGQRRPVDAEVKILREIFERYAKGETMKAIASSLNARGIPSPGASWARTKRRTDGRWLVSGIHTILHNEIYTGKVIWNRRHWVKNPDTGKRTYRERPQAQWVVHHLPELVLVEEDTWARCQKRLGPRHGGQRGPRRYILSGLLECAICNSKFIIYGGEPNRYICGSFHGGGQHACPNRITVERVLAETMILQPVLQKLLAPSAVNEMVEFMRREQRRDIKPVNTPDIERLDEEIAELTRLMKAGVLSPARAEVAITAAESEKAAALRDARRRLCGSAAYSTEQLANAFVAEAKRLRETIQGPNVVLGREALKEVVGAIVLTPEQEGHLSARFQRGTIVLATGSGVDRVVAGPGFGSIYPPIHLIKESSKRPGIVHIPSVAVGRKRLRGSRRG